MLLNEINLNRYKDHDVRLVEASGRFSRAQALEIGAKLFPLDALLFFVDVDMVFDQDLVRRIAWNTQQGGSVYFPIVFSQYDLTQIAGKTPKSPVFTNRDTNQSSKTTTLIHETKNQDHSDRAASTGNTGWPIRNTSGISEVSGIFDSKQFPHIERFGYWRQFGFGIVSIFHSDLMLVGGLDTTIEGWGKEDVDLFDKIVASNLTVFRAPDPGLIHVFHPIQCASSLSKEQSEMCRGTKLASTASWQDLALRVEETLPDLL